MQWLLYSSMARETRAMQCIAVAQRYSTAGGDLTGASSKQCVAVRSKAAAADRDLVAAPAHAVALSLPSD